MSDLGDLFAQLEAPPAPEEQPSYAEYERDSGADPAVISLRLVGKNPLWGHLLWNAGKVSAKYVDDLGKQLEGKTVLELGAAAALPSLLASLHAKNVVATDYPDPDLIANIQTNIDNLKASTGRDLPITTQGYIWGHDVQPLLNAPGQCGDKFDFLILSDVVFNHTEHDKLLETCAKTLAADGQILVVFSPHRPKLFDKDMAFFTNAQERGFVCDEIIEKELQPMFEEEEETKHIRSMVYGFLLHW